MPVLKGMHEDCGAFAMAIRLNYTGGNTELCYASHDDIGEILLAEEGRHADAETQDKNRWKRLDWIFPGNTSNDVCAEGSKAEHLQSANFSGSCYLVNASKDLAEFPERMGFPQGMGMLRWLDEVNKGLYLGLTCDNSMWSNRERFYECISSSKMVHDAYGQWEPKGNGTLVGDIMNGSFCAPAPEGQLRLQTWPRYPYRCVDGAQSSSHQALEGERNDLKALLKFSYFRCVSYDELFAVYVAIIGMLIAVAMTTTTLFFTEVACPLLERKVSVPEVIFRCAAAAFVGVVLGLTFIYIPWQDIRDKGCDETQPLQHIKD